MRMDSGHSLERDAQLDATIRFDAPLRTDWATPNKILLTGATGFLGAYLVDELLRQSDARLYCLVRAADSAAATARLKDHLQTLELWQADYPDRIITLCGDLAQPRLGLSERFFHELAEEIAVIYHNGALINNFAPYSQLRIPNVLGTQEVIRLAALQQRKPLHYVSSLAIFLSESYAGQTVAEDTPLVYDLQLQGGYRQSKWAAEALVQTAQQSGLPTTIHRPSRIWGHSQSGINHNLDDALCTVLKGCIDLGLFPISNTQIYLPPVDYVSRGIVQLSGKASSFGGTFHFCNAQTIHWLDLIELVRELGYPLSGVPYDEWFAAVGLAAREQPDKSFYRQLRLLLRSPIYLFVESRPRFCSQLTQSALSPLSCPHLDQALLATYFTWFQQSGFLPAPPDKQRQLSGLTSPAVSHLAPRG